MTEIMGIRIYDDNFAHTTSAGCPGSWRRSDLISWLRSGDDTAVTIFTDRYLGSSRRGVTSIAWILEPRSIIPIIYSSTDWSVNFDLVVTHDKPFVAALGDKGVYVTFGGCWVKDEDIGIGQKDKILSTIVSDKRDTFGHRLRHEIIDRFSDIEIDIFGRSYTKLENKIDGLRRYMYQIVVENQMVPGYFTEKIVDCFASGTVPIYWGDPDIGKIFDKSGFISFTRIEELDDILKTIGPVDYGNRSAAITNNFELCKKYFIPEDSLYWALNDRGVWQR